MCTHSQLFHTNSNFDPFSVGIFGPTHRWGISTDLDIWRVVSFFEESQKNETTVMQKLAVQQEVQPLLSEISQPNIMDDSLKLNSSCIGIFSIVCLTRCCRCILLLNQNTIWLIKHSNITMLGPWITWTVNRHIVRFVQDHRLATFTTAWNMWSLYKKNYPFEINNINTVYTDVLRRHQCVSKYILLYTTGCNKCQPLLTISEKHKNIVCLNLCCVMML